MAEEAGGGVSEKERMPISAIFALEELLTSDCRAAVIGRVLHEFPNLSEPARQALRTAVNGEVIPASGSFRRGQAGRALDGMRTILQEPMESGIRRSNNLASAVLKCWVDSHPFLAKESKEFLEEREVPVSGPDLPVKKFCGTWPMEKLRFEQDAFSRAHEGYKPGDVALMLCYLTGNFPLQPDPAGSAQEGSATLSEAFSFLQSLPATSPMWEGVVPNFVASVSRLMEDKAAQLRWAADFDESILILNNEFGELLAFFEQDTHEWSAERVSRQADTSAALGLVAHLRTLLVEYKEVHEMASGISEERERSQKRATLQASILDTLKDVVALMTEDPGEMHGEESALQSAAQDARATVVPDPVGPALDLPRSTAILTATDKDAIQTSSLQEAQRVIKVASEGQVIAGQDAVGAAEYESLRTENTGLRDGSSALLSANQDLRDEIEALKTELFSSQEREESWRMAYRSAKEGTTEVVHAAEPSVNSVHEAVEIAKSRFRQELLFAPNSESNVDGNPFIDPAKVWEALQWLANTYYPSKMGRLRVTDFDQSIKEACGWWYKGDQGETTVSKFEKSYTTRVDGKRYTLVEHIGKGTTFDARYTIRIAFDWDRGKRQVIVGYIGRHQQTDAS